MDKDELSQNLN